MKARDFDYIESRLLDGRGTEAVQRLRDVGRPDLAEQVMEAAKQFNDVCRAVRLELYGQRGT